MTTDNDLDHHMPCSYGIVAVKRDWVPHWLFGWFCPRAGTYQPLRWMLTRPVDDVTRRRVNGKPAKSP